MNAVEPPPDDLAALITAINDLLPSMAMTHEDLELDSVAHRTGIPEEVVLALLRGEPVPDEALNPGFTDRLAFLLDTRRAPDGKPYKQIHIADALGLSRGMVSALLSGGREAGRAVTASLEEFFDVDPGFLSTNGRRALARALRPVCASLLTLSTLRGERVSHLAMRSSIDVADIRLAGRLQEALAAVLTTPSPPERDPSERNPSEQDPPVRDPSEPAPREQPPWERPSPPEPPTDPEERELREIADQVRALAPPSRTRLMGKIRGLLRQP
ncbi:helix-turn-helix domain-containing protein [Streptomyces sp. bgisy082]|uniref:helix-turn-helix domain-containing protein n=1 Tax=Streptomyces sp. bgisy082 TaxID=3413776 RepID=UPI003D70EEE9